jgi:hypothetical protein
VNHPFARLEDFHPLVAIERGTILLECEHSWRVINIFKIIIMFLGNDEDICGFMVLFLKCSIKSNSKSGVLGCLETYPAVRRHLRS